jgi:hypothetical protein
MLWAEVILNTGKYFQSAEWLAGKHIQIDIIRLFHKMCSDVGCLNELDQCVPGLVPLSKVLDLWRAIGLHINPSDKVVTEPCDGPGTADGSWAGVGNIDYCMDTPRHLT